MSIGSSKAAPTPYFNLQELCDEFRVGQLRREAATVEIVALRVVMIHAESRVEGTKAKLALIMVNGLEPHKAAIGYRVFEGNKVVRRGMVSGAELGWEVVDVHIGRTEIEVPLGALVDCVATFAGIAQHHFWIGDPNAAQNPLRSVHHAFDGNLAVLQELVAKSQHRSSNARDLELAVSWLLWMLGFSTTHIGGCPKTSDAPDLIAVSPRGDLVVVECTTGILKEDSKLSHLCQRAEKVRQGLAASGHKHLKVLPVIVTTKTRDEVKTELENAYKSGVLVVTIEDFGELIRRTTLFPDPNGLFSKAEASLRARQNPSPFQDGITK